MTIYRVTGKAGKISERSGSTDGRPWTMRSQDIELAPLVVTPVSLPDGDQGYPLGQDVDLAVDVHAKGGYLRTEVRSDWPRPAGVHAVKAS